MEQKHFGTNRYYADHEMGKGELRQRRWEPNTRETVRRQSVHQLVQAGVALYNSDNPKRPVNSPHAVYEIAPEVLRVLKAYKTTKYKEELEEYLSVHKTLAEMYAKERQMAMVH